MKKIDKIFQFAYKNHSEEPPESIWNAIQNELDKEDRRNGYIKMNAALKRAILCCILLMLGFELYDHLGYRINNGSVLSTPTQTSSTGDNTHPGNAKGQQNYSARQQPASVNFSKETFVPSSGAHIAGDIVNIHFNDTPHQLLDVDVSKKMTMDTNLLLKRNLVPLLSQPGARDSTAKLNSRQNSDKKKKIDNRFMLTPFISINLLRNKLEDAFEFYNEPAQEIEELERNKSSFSLGAFVDYQLSKKWMISSGVSYTGIKNSVAPSYVKAVGYDNKVNYLLATTYGVSVIKNLNNPNPALNDSFLLAGNSKLQVHYITIPLAAKYQLYQTNKLHFYASAGPGINVVTNATLNVEETNTGNTIKQESSTIQGVKHVFYSGMFGLETDYKLNKKISLNLQVQFSHSFTAVNTNVPVKNFINNIGIIAGVKIPL